MSRISTVAHRRVRKPSSEMHSSEPVIRRFVFVQSMLGDLRVEKVRHGFCAIWRGIHVLALEAKLDGICYATLDAPDTDHFDVVVHPYVPLLGTYGMGEEGSSEPTCGLRKDTRTAEVGQDALAEWNHAVVTKEMEVGVEVVINAGVRALDDILGRGG
jgi:hypothetical protein